MNLRLARPDERRYCSEIYVKDREKGDPFSTVPLSDNINGIIINILDDLEYFMPRKNPIHH